MSICIADLHKLISKEAQRIISEHIEEDPHELSLELHDCIDLPVAAIAAQIACRKKALSKLPSLSKYPLLYETQALQMCSGEACASYKSQKMSGKRIADLTGGLGIDSIFFSKKFNDVLYCEKNELICELFRYNTSVLGVKNVSVYQGDSIEMINAAACDSFDWIYIDPSRRNSSNRVVALEKSIPNVLAHEKTFLRAAPNVCIKSSPLLEINYARDKLENLKEVIVVSVGGECKEILLYLARDKLKEKNVRKRAVVMNSDGIPEYEAAYDCSFATNHPEVTRMGKYWYEPDVAIRKADVVMQTALEFSLRYASKKAGFLTSDRLMESFPGRSFFVVKWMPWKRRAVKEYLSSMKISKANVTRRDFFMPVESIRRMFGLREGGSEYLFFTGTQKNALFVHCRKNGDCQE